MKEAEARVQRPHDNIVEKTWADVEIIEELFYKSPVP